ncbi:endolytic transglycosylase MltG [Arthrobacter sp. Sr24]
MSDKFQNGDRTSSENQGTEPNIANQPYANQPYNDEQPVAETYWQDGSEDTLYTGHSDYEHYDAHEAHDEPGHNEAGESDAYDPVAEAGLPSRRTSRVSKRVRKRRRSLVFLVILVLFGAVVYFAVQTVKPMLGGFTVPDYPGPGTGNVQIVVPEGATGRTVATELKAQDVVASEQAFLDALKAAEGSASLQPGEFPMKSQMKASDAVAVLLATDANRVHYAAVAQNLRLGETLKILAESTDLPLAEFEKLANQPAEFGLPPQAKNLEGYLSPGEYRFPIETDAKSVVQELVTKTTSELTDSGVTDPSEQYRILTVASIIEFEGNEANYSKISGAIENRLNKPNEETGGRLESDATVAYGLGIKSYELTAAEKADKSNLYNTFANPGLPVGPIGSPSVKAIEAAAQPESNPYYFWVTINLDTGETLYAATFAEHQANVGKYVAWCGANPGKCE